MLSTFAVLGCGPLSLDTKVANYTENIQIPKRTSDAGPAQFDAALLENPEQAVPVWTAGISRTKIWEASFAEMGVAASPTLMPTSWCRSQEYYESFYFLSP